MKRQAYRITLLFLACGLARSFVSRARISLMGRDRIAPTGSKLFVSSSPPTNASSDASVSKSSSSPSDDTPPPPPLPVFNGQRVLPVKVLLGGLASQPNEIPAVYAILNKSYRRGTEGWGAVEHVGLTSDLGDSVQRHCQDNSDDDRASRVAHVRALSFAVPEPSAMRKVALQWREQARAAGAPLDRVAWRHSTLEYLEDEEDDDDDDEDNDWQNEIPSQAAPPAAIASPFADKGAISSGDETVAAGSGGRLPLTAENIDRVLEEVRPYLIADGGNVAVSRVDADRKIVYLQLEGACGSCPSSTVTMQMGIERVLKENFDVDQVLQEDDPNKPTELTWQAVELEINRIRPALVAMGGVCDLVGVDAATGLVKIKFRGFNKVQQGLELALRDVPFVNSVQFVTGDDE